MSRKIETFDSKNCIEGFSVNLKDYKKIQLDNTFKDTLSIFTRGDAGLPNIEYALARGLNTDKIFPNIIIISGPVSKRTKLIFKSYGNVVYLGGDSGRAQLAAKVILNNSSSLLLGKGVSSNGLELNISNPGCMIGDDCMFGRSVKVRTHTGHAFYDVNSKEITTASRMLQIEPHVWIGEGARIFKCGFIGACSIVGYESVLTRDLPRFSTAAGAPAKIFGNQTKLWLRSKSESHINKAKSIYNKFCIKGKNDPT